MATDIAKEKEKLAQTMIASNQASLDIEEKRRSLEELNKQEANLLYSIDLLEKKVQEAESSYDTLTRKHNDDIAILSSEKKTLESSIVALVDQEKAEKESLAATLATGEKELQESSAKRDAVVDNIKYLDTVVLAKEKCIEGLDSKKLQLYSEIEAIDNTKKLKEDEVSSLESKIDSQSSMVLHQSTIISEQEKTIADNAEKVKDLGNDIKDATTELDTIQSDKATATLELETLQDGIKDINSLKFSVQARSEALDRREHMIKQKYEDAGISYL